MQPRSHLFTGVSATVLGLLLASAAVAQQALPTISIGGARGPARPVAAPPGPAPAPRVAATTPPGFSEEKRKLPIYREPTGQTFTTVSAKNFDKMPLLSVRDMLIYSPGVSIKWGNGIRDNVISIRGSGARNGFGVRNIMMFMDGFPITQPDGLSRTDQLDPHQLGGVDVYRGPSSALFGNYANGGAINFRTRRGSEINGFETGHEFGSFGYLNNWFYGGKAVENWDVSIFASDARTEGFTQHNQSDTQTVGLDAVWKPTPNDRVIFKGLHNQTYTNLSGRLSLAQFYNNPYQQGCTIYGGFLNYYCASANVPINGFNGTRGSFSADQIGFHRNDRRDLFGLRWEHDIDANTVWRTQAVYDDKNIRQPTGATAALNDVPSINASTDITSHTELFGMPATHWLGFFFNRARSASYTTNTLPYGNGAIGGTTAKTNYLVQNIGLRGREEVALSPTVTGVLGLAGEFTRTDVHLDSYNYSPTATRPPFGVVDAHRAWWNVAPEASVTWRPDSVWKVYARASSGFGTPQSGQLTTGQNGLPGNNTGLQPQRNTGFDAGFTWTPDERVSVTLNAFHEWYTNELIGQNPGGQLSNYTFNAPGSVHRGAEFLAEWRPFDGARLLANYTYNNQIFTSFNELVGGVYFDRAGYKIPGVAPHELTARGGYDIPYGDFRGLGGFVEYVYKSSYFLDNANQLTIPSYGLVNLNVHYDTELAPNPLFLKNFTAYFQVSNVFDRTWVMAANNISNSLTNGFQTPGALLAYSQTGAIYAGAPQSFQGGVRFKF